MRSFVVCLLHKSLALSFSLGKCVYVQGLSKYLLGVICDNISNLQHAFVFGAISSTHQNEVYDLL